MNFVRNGLNRAYLGISILGSVALIALMGIVGGNVLLRLVGGVFQGSYEVAETAIIVTVTTAIVMATVRQSHVSVRLIVDRFPERLREINEIVMLLIGAVYWAVVTAAVFVTTANFARLGEITPVLEINMIPYRWFLTVGVTLVSLVLFGHAAIAIYRLMKK